MISLSGVAAALRQHMYGIICRGDWFKHSAYNQYACYSLLGVAERLQHTTNTTGKTNTINH